MWALVFPLHIPFLLQLKMSETLPALVALVLFMPGVL